MTKENTTEENTTTKKKPAKKVKVQVLKLLSYGGATYYPTTILLDKPDPSTDSGHKEIKTIVEMDEETIKAFGKRYVKKV